MSDPARDATPYRETKNAFSILHERDKQNNTTLQSGQPGKGLWNLVSKKGGKDGREITDQSVITIWDESIRLWSSAIGAEAGWEVDIETGEEQDATGMTRAAEASTAPRWDGVHVKGDVDGRIVSHGTGTEWVLETLTRERNDFKGVRKTQVFGLLSSRDRNSGTMHADPASWKSAGLWGGSGLGDEGERPNDSGWGYGNGQRGIGGGPYDPDRPGLKYTVEVCGWGTVMRNVGIMGQSGASQKAGVDLPWMRITRASYRPRPDRTHPVESDVDDGEDEDEYGAREDIGAESLSPIFGVLEETVGLSGRVAYDLRCEDIARHIDAYFLWWSEEAYSKRPRTLLDDDTTMSGERRNVPVSQMTWAERRARTQEIRKERLKLMRALPRGAVAMPKSRVEDTANGETGGVGSEPVSKITENNWDGWGQTGQRKKKKGKGKGGTSVAGGSETASTTGAKRFSIVRASVGDTADRSGLVRTAQVTETGYFALNRDAAMDQWLGGVSRSLTTEAQGEQTRSGDTLIDRRDTDENGKTVDAGERRSQPDRRESGACPQIQNQGQNTAARNSRSTDPSRPSLPAGSISHPARTYSGTSSRPRDWPEKILPPILERPLADTSTRPPQPIWTQFQRSTDPFQAPHNETKSEAHNSATTMCIEEDDLDPDETGWSRDQSRFPRRADSPVQAPQEELPPFTDAPIPEEDRPENRLRNVLLAWPGREGEWGFPRLKFVWEGDEDGDGDGDGEGDGDGDGGLMAGLETLGVD